MFINYKREIYALTAWHIDICQPPALNV